MVKKVKIVYFLFAIILPFQELQGQQPIPVPANEIQFQVPLSDGTTGAGMVCWMPDGNGVFVISSPSGKIALLRFTKGILPPIINPPIVIPPIDPPKPPKPSVSSFITVTDTEQWKINQLSQKVLSDYKIQSFAYTVSLVADPNPPANSLKWIGRTAGKEYPYSFFAGQNGEILWEGTTPESPADFLLILREFDPPEAKSDSCPNGVCPPARRLKR